MRRQNVDARWVTSACVAPIPPSVFFFRTWAQLTEQKERNCVDTKLKASRQWH